MYMTHSKHLDKFSNEKMRPDLEPEKPGDAKPRAAYILQAAGGVGQEQEEGGNLLKVFPLIKILNSSLMFNFKDQCSCSFIFLQFLKIKGTLLMKKIR